MSQEKACNRPCVLRFHCFASTLQCQKRLNYQKLYEEALTNQSALNQEIADLKLTLQQTQQGITFLQVSYPVCSKWFEPRSISSSYCVIVRVRVVLKRTVVGD